MEWKGKINLAKTSEEELKLELKTEPPDPDTNTACKN
jgi:hypothetical protein